MRFGYRKGEGTSCGDGPASSSERESCYVVTVTEGIERAECSCKMNGYLVSDIEMLCTV